MKKNNYVEFTGLLPKELQGVKTPIFGQVEKKMGKTKVVVKPRYKRFEVVVNVADLTVVSHEAYQGKKKKKTVAKKTPLKPLKATNEMKPCETKKDLKPNAGIKKVVAKAKEEVNKPSFKTDSAEKLTVPKMPEELPLNSPVMDKFAKKEEEDVKPYNWVQDDPINKQADELKTPYQKDMEEYLDDQETSRGGAVVWGVVVIIVAVAIGAYFLFF